MLISISTFGSFCCELNISPDHLQRVRGSEIIVVILNSLPICVLSTENLSIGVVSIGNTQTGTLFFKKKIKVIHFITDNLEDTMKNKIQ